MVSKPFVRFCFYISCVLLGSVVCVQEAQATWTVEPVDTEGNSGWSLFIDVDSTGRPAASYFTTDPNGYQRYSVRTDTGWAEDREVEFADAFQFDNNDVAHFLSTPRSNFYPTLTSTGTGGPSYDTPIESIRIANGRILGFDDQNYPHVAYINTGTRTLRYAAWNGSSWNHEDVATSDSFQFGNSYFVGALDPTGGAHFVFPDGDSLFDQPMTYAAPNGSGWTESRVTNSNGAPGRLVIDSTGMPHLVLQRPAGSLVYATYNGSSWDTDTVNGLIARSNFDPELVLGPNEEPHLFVHDSEFLGDEFIKHVYLDGNSWENETIDTWSDSSDGPESITGKYVDGKFFVLFSTGNQEVFFASKSIPEPASAMLFALAVMCCHCRRRRK